MNSARRPLIVSCPTCGAEMIYRRPLRLYVCSVCDSQLTQEEYVRRKELCGND